MYIAYNADILNEEDSTFNFCLAFLLSFDRVKLNRQLLIDCTFFHSRTKRRFQVR